MPARDPSTNLRDDAACTCRLFTSGYDPACYYHGKVLWMIEPGWQARVRESGEAASGSTESPEDP